MNKFHPRLSPWFFISISMATGTLIGIFLKKTVILLGFLALFTFFGVISKHYDFILLSIFFLAGYIRAQPIYILQKLLKNEQKTVISGEFIIYNEQFLRLPGTYLYFSIDPKDLPQGTRVCVKGYFENNYKRLKLMSLYSKSPSKNLFDKSHQKIKTLLEEICGKYEEGALLKALLIGDRGFLSRKTKENFRYAGAAHILAISGLHINFLFTLFFTFFMFILRNKVAADVFSLILVSLYVLSLGPLSPCYRAFMFLFFNVLSSWLKRKTVSLNIWGLAFAISILLYPTWLTEPSFLFSYFSVLGYIITSRKIDKQKPKALQAILRYIYAVLIPMVFTFPLQLIFFHYLTPMGLISNLFLLPCASLTIFETIFCLLFKLINCNLYLPFANCALYLAHIMLKLASFFGKQRTLVINI